MITEEKFENEEQQTEDVQEMPSRKVDITKVAAILFVIAIYLVIFLKIVLIS